jgi:hypothetical protein
VGGCIVITQKKTLPSGAEVVNTMDGCSLLPSHNMHITYEWLERDENGWTSSSVKVNATTTAKVILVVEKEGIFQHLINARFFEKYPCILVTGKGCPDIATRAFVRSLHKELDLPVVGICDYNPHGIQVLGAYYSSNLWVLMEGIYILFQYVGLAFCHHTLLPSNISFQFMYFKVLPMVI